MRDDNIKTYQSTNTGGFSMSYTHLCVYSLPKPGTISDGEPN